MKIILEREKCIGCGSCAAVCPKCFKMVEDGKSSLLNSQKDGQGNEVGECGEDCAKEAAEVCPVQVIKIE
ncbi:MAG: ferredoxin [Candidatus Portnoybacteria bacterium]|nr:ferredoxin [Candidatus Portnoybacteria bacterium]